MYKCEYCGGKGWCFLPYQALQMPYTWEGGRLGTLLTFERMVCPICHGLGKLLLPVGPNWNWVPSKWLYTGPDR